MASSRRRRCIYVLAGTNGAGKSSVAGAMFRQARADHFNPDQATARILVANPDISTAEANSAAWHEGRRLLERAIGNIALFTFTTGESRARCHLVCKTEYQEVAFEDFED